MSGALWICDSAIGVPSTILTCLIGLWTAVNKSLHLGTWEQLSSFGVLAPSALIVFGWSWFSYSHEVKTFLFLKRIQVVFLLGVLMQWLLVCALFKSAPAFQRHPLSDLIYKANIEQDRWLRHATTSHDLPVAIKVYQDRHDGRNPPPFFHEWYKLAKETKVVDEFRQIDRDLAPFRKVPAKYLRQRVTIMAEVPGVETIIIQEGGKVSHSDAGDDVKNQELEELVKIISNFAGYLPQMVIPINLSPMPRILPSWNEAQSTSRADLSSMVDFIQSRTSAKEDEPMDKSQSGNKIVQRSSEKSWSFTSARDLQDMHLAACPPTSKSRTSPHWRISDFCTVCARRHSKGPIMTTWEKSLEVCYQPDIYHLHGFFMTNPAIAPLHELLPLFSASKMDGFSDIILPLPSTIVSSPDVEKALDDRKNSLFWRGRPGEHALSSQALRGSHKLRLMHLVTNPDPSEQVTMVLPFPDKADVPKEDSNKDRRKLKDEFGYEEVSAAEASRALPFDVRLQQEGPCLGPMCALVQSIYPQDDSSSAAAFGYRYILLTDEDNGPPRDVMGALRSGSVPFISTTFRTWYTERLLPWLHFVPIDTRFQALHTTLSYFAGTEGRPPLNGRETNMKEQSKDAKWIASQGRKWADAALGQKDLEVYMFRLLLEWGRLIDDERDKIGFWQDAKGELQSAGWTPRQKDSAAS
ncbi:glycosyltransferase family 90 protein [Sarocladium implicatum]|nr:glycosyltransferase family 90 protein [Sarocladium implicatum]